MLEDYGATIKKRCLSERLSMACVPICLHPGENCCWLSLVLANRLVRVVKYAASIIKNEKKRGSDCGFLFFIMVTDTYKVSNKIMQDTPGTKFDHASSHMFSVCLLRVMFLFIPFSYVCLLRCNKKGRQEGR